MRQGGTLSVWNDEKGYGFITPDRGGDQVFVHISEFRERWLRPAQFQRVDYVAARDPRGRACAKYVTRPGVKAPADGDRQVDYALYMVAGAFLLAVAGIWLAGRAPVVIPALYTGASLLAFGSYWKDKAAAQAGRWRTSESALHLLSFLGGWPGALVAQRLLHHKSRKVSFQLVYWITVGLNIAALGLLLTPPGSRHLATVIRQLTEGH